MAFKCHFIGRQAANVPVRIRLLFWWMAVGLGEPFLLGGLDYLHVNWFVIVIDKVEGGAASTVW